MSVSPKIEIEPDWLTLWHNAVATQSAWGDIMSDLQSRPNDHRLKAAEKRAERAMYEAERVINETAVTDFQGIAVKLALWRRLASADEDIFPELHSAWRDALRLSELPIEIEAANG